ncbi:hypothetical protein [Streptosporangium sp. NPDC006930]|uniref:hypothetical protein n=1 Tax=Streptosporangium sp. NPDC006930 TaxID=3154783 RepID=UPI003415D061
MIATLADEQDQAAAVMIAALLTNLIPAARDEIIRRLSVDELRTAYAAANKAPRQWRANDDTEQIGELMVVPCDHGGWQILIDEHGLILDVEGCWIPYDAATDDAVTWSHRALAIAAATATL